MAWTLEKCQSIEKRAKNESPDQYQLLEPLIKACYRDWEINSSSTRTTTAATTATTTTTMKTTASPTKTTTAQEVEDSQALKKKLEIKLKKIWFR